MAEDSRSSFFFGSPLFTSILALCGLGGAGFLVLPKNQEAASKPAMEAEAKESKAGGREASFEAPAYDPLRILETYFAKRTAKEKDEETPKYTGILSAQPGSILGSFFEKQKKEKAPEVDLKVLKNDLKKFDLELVIACLPDPLQTKFAHEFDWTIDAIQRAFETQGMTLRHYDLPWQLAQNKTSDEKKISQLLETPGVLLFSKSRTAAQERNKLEPEKLALAFLVGESPIAGIAHRQFDKAVEACRRLGKFKLNWPFPERPEGQRQLFKNAGKDCLKANHWLTIIGPYYSGSQTQLARALHRSLIVDGGRLRDDLSPFCIQVFNGGASELKSPSFSDFGGLENNHLIPRSLIVPNDLLMLSISNFICGDRSSLLHFDKNRPLYISHGKTIILNESNTAFGTRSLNHLSGIASYGFPISLSQLSSSHQEQSKKNVTLPYFDFVEPRLTLRPFSKSDAIVPFDPQSNATAAGQWLRMIIEIIQTENVRYVGILATDTRDVVFLNRVLKNECHNIQVFTTEPNIAVQHPEDSKDLRGLLVASSYPNYGLLNVAEATLRAGAKRSGRGLLRGKSVATQVFFPATSGYGYFNAVIAGKGRDEHLLWCNASRSLPLDKATNNVGAWVSMIGTGGKMVPLHFYPIDPVEKDSFDPNNKYINFYTTDNRAIIDHIPFTSFTNTFVIELFIVWGLIIYVIIRIIETSPLKKSFKTFLAGSQAEVTPETVFWTTVCLLGLLLAAGAFAIPGLTLDPRANGFFSDFIFTFVFFCSLFIPFSLIIISFAICMIPLWFYKVKANLGNSPSNHYLDKVILFRLFLSYIINASVFFILFLFSSLDNPLTPLLYFILWILETIKICSVFKLYIKYAPLMSQYRKLILIYFLVMYFMFCLFPVAILLPDDMHYFNDLLKYFILFRINDQSSGLSPLAPMLLLGLAAFILGLHMVRTELAQFDHCVCGKLNLDLLGRESKDFAEHLNRFSCIPAGSLAIKIDTPGSLRNTITSFPSMIKSAFDFHITTIKQFKVILLPLAIFILCFLYEILVVQLSSSESHLWDITITISTTGILFAITIGIIRVLELWYILKGILDVLKKSPFKDSFKNTPKEIKNIFSHYFGSISGKASDFNKLVDTLEPEKRSRLLYLFQKSHSRFISSSLGKKIKIAADETTALEATIFLKNQLNVIFNDEFNESYLSANSFLDKLCKQERQFDLSDFSLSYLVLFFAGIIAQLKKTIFAVMGSIALAFLAFTSYPFQPEGLFIYFLVFQMLCLVVLICFILYELNVHPIPSNITGTTPDQFSLDWKFINSIAQFVAPLLLLLALHFLGFLRFMIEPILDLLR